VSYPPAIQAIVAELEATPKHTPATLGHALRHKLAFDDVMPWIGFDVVNYSRNMVLQGKHWELRLFCWRPGQSTSLHGHGTAACCFRVLRGNANEIVLGERDRKWAPGAVVEEATHLVHQVSNAGPDALLTLHAYSPQLPVDRPSDPRGRAVVVIGGGFAGAAATYHLLKGASPDLRITLIERGPWIGRGIAYGVESPVFRLNVPASKMSIDPSTPNDFVEWADAHHAPHQFLSRTRYGRYVEERLAQAIRESRGKLRVLRADAVAIEPHLVRLSDGRELDASAVILATGIEPRVAPSSLAADPRIIDAWDECALPTLPADGRVLVLGSGLSAIDVLALLKQRAFRGRVTILSRRGLLPGPHLEPFTPGHPVDGVDIEKVPRSLRGQIRWLRSRIAQLAKSDVPWQRVIDGLRAHVTPLWQSMPPKDRARFVKVVRPYWDSARHRAPADALELVETWRKEGRLEVIAGRVLGCEPKSEGLDVTIRRRDGDRRHERYDAIVRCIGPALEQTEARGPLVTSLLESGLAARDPAGLGIVTDANGHVVGADGKPSDWLLTLGAVRRASAWETTAVPEISLHAQQLAHRAARHNG
jgi:uncharacterized NAD(P)/FAD-binding protein YdhS